MTKVFVIALLILGIDATCSAADSFPTATPESQGLSSQSLGKLMDVVHGFAEKGDIVGGELLDANLCSWCMQPRSRAGSA